MTFDDLEFFPNHLSDGEGARVFFANGYGASVVRSQYSYGGNRGLYELAVLRRGSSGWSPVYNTPITNDVEGNLTPEDVTAFLGRIEALPPAKEPDQ